MKYKLLFWGLIFTLLLENTHAQENVNSKIPWDNSKLKVSDNHREP
ncbi:MAG: hypothetical protein LBE91_16060 [Tannerella sp.]|nr:hypothetical protein [Tannerella sp.]